MAALPVLPPRCGSARDLTPRRRAWLMARWLRARLIRPAQGCQMNRAAESAAESLERCRWGPRWTGANSPGAQYRPALWARRPLGNTYCPQGPQRLAEEWS